MSIKVKTFQSTEALAWDAYVHAHPRALLYHLSGWKKVIEKTYGHKTYYLMAIKSNRRIKRMTTDNGPARLASESVAGRQRTTDKLPHGKLYELPLSTVRFGGFNIPCAGGGYFRLFPYKFTRRLLNSLNNAGKPFIFYLHPWELNKNLPEVKGANPLGQFRTRINLQKTEEKLKKLIQDFKFSSVMEVLDL